MNKQHQVVQQSYTATHILEDDGIFPNNKCLALIVYKGAFHLLPEDPAESIKQVFKRHKWTNCWQNGLDNSPHYHSTAHQVIGIYCGTAKIQFGGSKGVIVEVNRGDALIIPAGVAYKNLECSEDFNCIGAYPEGQEPDFNSGLKGERPLVDENIRNVKLPIADPVYGDSGSVMDCWL